MTRRVLVSPALNEPRDRESLPAWFRRAVPSWASQLFDQIRYILTHGAFRDQQAFFEGNGNPEVELEVWRDDGVWQANITASGYNINGGGTFHGRHARGTRAAPTPSQADDITAGIGSRACYTNDSFHASSPASIHWQVTENQTASAYGMWVRFLTTQKGSTTRREVGGFTDNQTIWSHDTGTYDAKSSAQTLPIADARFVASATNPTTGCTYVSVAYGEGVTPGFRGLHARGTAGTPTATQDDDMIAFLGGHGYGTSFPSQSKALIAMHAAENWSATAQGTYIVFETTTPTTTTRVERLRIDENGRLITTLANHADDAAAATGGVPVGGLYRTDSAVKIRVA